MTDRRAEALERLATWERDARAVKAEPYYTEWHWNYPGQCCSGGYCIDGLKVHAADRISPAGVAHVVNMQPDVALRLIEGLRTVLDYHQPRPWRSNVCNEDEELWPCPNVVDVTNAILGPGAEGTQEGERDEGWLVGGGTVEDDVNAMGIYNPTDPTETRRPMVAAERDADLAAAQARCCSAGCHQSPQDCIALHPDDCLCPVCR